MKPPPVQSRILLLSIALSCSVDLAAAPPPQLDWARQILASVRATSYADLGKRQISVRPLASQADFFQARFRILDFFYRPHIRYILFANPAGPLRGIPEDGMRAIVAHELAHVEWYARGSRLHLLTLVRLAGPHWRAKFERCADMAAIRRGYGIGLEHYREWQYNHLSPRVVAEKKRDYLQPKEIEALIVEHPGKRDCP